MICSNCHHPKLTADFISPKRIGPTRTCTHCREAVASTRQRRNEGTVRRYEVAYYRLDIGGLACLNCPLAKCVFETGEDIELCPL